MKSHRGLASVVGAVFLIAIVIGALSYITYSLEIMGDFSEALITEESRLKDKQRESFEITSIDITTANKLDGVIKNTGEIPVEIKTLYIDEQGVNDVIQKFTLDTQIAQGNTANLIDVVDFTMDPTKGYNMKIVTSRGEVNSFYVNSASQENIHIQLLAIPETLVTNFDATIIMTVVNNMSNSNILVNLTPEDPIPTCASPDCILVSGPDPSSYDVLKSGDIALFKWSYKLSGLKGDTFTFTGAVQNGNPGNDDSQTVTIDVPEYAESSGVALESLGFGQTDTIDNLFILHEETFGIPATWNYQLTPLVPDSLGTSETFNSVDDEWKFMSSNVTATDAHFPAGVWNASLRYYSDHLPSGMTGLADDIWKNNKNGGIKLHFEDITPASGIYISSEDETCYSLQWTGDTGISGNPIWSATDGVNGSGAYLFDSGDYLRIEGSIHNNCANPHGDGYTVAAWFKSTAEFINNSKQTILMMWDTSDCGDDDCGGYKLVLGNGNANQRGTVFFTNLDEIGNEHQCESYGDTDSDSIDYADGQWHHVVGTMNNNGCYMYVDGNNVDYDAGGDKHLDGDDDIYIGAAEGGGSEFVGYIDDVMIWMNFDLPQGDVTALFEHSFGYNSTNMHFTLGNYTDTGVLSNQIVNSNDYGMKWSDQGHYSNLWDQYRGGNYTVSLPEVRLNINDDSNRLGFTMSYASGEPIYMLMDEGDLDGTESVEYDMSSYLQPPDLVDPQVLPVFYTWDRKDKTVEFFAYSAGNQGSWFTFQGTRIIFNGTNGNFAGLVETIGNGIDPPVSMGFGADSPFISPNTDGDFVFHAPQANPEDTFPAPADRVPEGNYGVTIFLNGYDESGKVFIRSISIGTILVIDE
jgi:hypothetical protein